MSSVPLTIHELQQESHANAVDKGFWEQPRTIPEQIALMHSELSEALEEFRDGRKLNEVRYEIPDVEQGKFFDAIPADKPVGFPIELADAIIRIADTAEHYGINLEEALRLKMAYNRTRPYRHGGKLA